MQFYGMFSCIHISSLIEVDIDQTDYMYVPFVGSYYIRNAPFHYSQISKDKSMVLYTVDTRRVFLHVKAAGLRISSSVVSIGCRD